MRITRVRLAVFAAALAAPPAAAQPLNPNNFSTIATSFAPTGNVTINTDTLQITGTGFTTVTGVTAAQANGGPTLAVFDFGSISIPSGVTVSATGSRPFALLSQGSATVAGTINLSGANASNIPLGAAGVAGGGNGGLGANQVADGSGLPGEGIGGGGGAIGGGGASAGGGGFGGAGTAGNGSAGGISYGNLLFSLQAGSGGGGGGVDGSASGLGGGAGGGAMQLGGIGNVTLVSGSILANGGNGAAGSSQLPSGGGSGGGVLLTGNSITTSGGGIDCGGGLGGAGSPFAGGGGGGRIAVVETTYTVGDTIGTSVSGGSGITNGQSGVRSLAPTTTIVPAAQSLTVTSNAIAPNFEQFLTSNYNVAGTLTLTNSSQTINTLTGSGSVTLTGTTLTVGSGDASGTFSGHITGNGGITKVGNGTLTLTGTGNTFSGGLTVNAGTVQGSVASLPSAITDNGTVAFNETGTVTYSGSITGTGSVTKLGSGTLTLGGSQGYSGGTIVNGGILNVAADNSLGAAGTTVTVNNGGRLQYTASDFTTRTFNLNSGTLAAASGANLTLNGAVVTGGFLRGAGTFTVTGGAVLSGVTTVNSTVINQTGAGTFQNFSNGGALTVAAGLASPVTLDGFTNQGSGTITIGAGSAISASDFETYGMLTLTPNTTAAPTILTNTGTSPLYFNGGSETFIGTPQTADQTGQNVVDYIDLHGNNAVVAGGLLVNNGGVFDTVGVGTATIVAEFGALVKGAGFYQNTVKTQNGGKFQTGNSPGSATFGNFVFGPGGVNNYIFAIDDATGTAGPSPNAAGLVSGWGLIKAVQVSLGAATTSGNFTWTATPTNPLTVAIDTLINPTMVGTDVAGPMADFDPTQSYSWTAARWTGNYAGPTDAATLDADTSFDTSGFVNPIAGTFGWSLSGSSLSLSYTPTAVPEPGTLALIGAAAFGLIWRSRARRHPS